MAGKVALVAALVVAGASAQRCMKCVRDIALLSHLKPDHQRAHSLL
jgi:hypothetical protein